MKIRNLQIAALVKKLKQPHGGLRSPQIMHPTREWFVGLMIAILILAAAATWGSATYITYRDVSVHDQAEEVSAAAYRELQVEQALSDLRERDVEHQTLRGMSNAPAAITGIEPIVTEQTATSTDITTTIATTTQSIATSSEETNPTSDIATTTDLP